MPGGGSDPINWRALGVRHQDYIPAHLVGSGAFGRACRAYERAKSKALREWVRTGKPIPVLDGMP